jgi:ABC-2 type transport system permease protein
MRPVFKYGVAFCAGVAFGTETAYFMSWDGKPVVLTICVLIWSVVGYFAAEMLLQKSFRVWKKWPGALVTMGVMGALCLCLVMDVFGVVAKVPQAQDVAYVTAGRFGYPYDGGNGWEQVTDEEEIEKFLALHRAILAEKDVTRDSYENALYGFELSYVLKNGSVISRRYSFVPLVKSEIDQVGTVTWCANQILQDRDLVAQFYDLDEAEQGSLNNVWLEDVYNEETHDKYDEVDVGEMTEANLYTLWKAVRQDFAEGNIGKCYLFSDEEMYRECYQSQIYFNWVKTGTGKNSTESESRYITLTYAAKNTLKWLEENGILGEDYQLMEYAGYEENEKETIYYTH